MTSARQPLMGESRAALSPRLWAEGIGTAGLLAVVVGSGLMAERLAGGNGALALLANSLATGAGLFALIVVFGPVSGAHFNPAVSASSCLAGEISSRDGLCFCAVQFAGAVCGVWVAHAMFSEPLLQVSTHQRAGFPLIASEAVATFGLLLVIRAGARNQSAMTPAAVALYITAAYWFTSSTSFANPAVTIARALTDTFTGIDPANVPGFLLAQLVAVGGVSAAERLLWPARRANAGSAAEASDR